jgi:hypothetical protein
LPGVKADSLREMVSAERAHGVFSRQLLLGENLDTDSIEASCHDEYRRIVTLVAGWWVTESAGSQAISR